jgi:hypothetical protein
MYFCVSGAWHSAGLTCLFVSVIVILQMLCGTEPFPEKFKAKKYKLHEHFITKKNFFHMMSNLPEEVSMLNAF